MPPDRSTRAILTVRATGAVELVDREPSAEAPPDYSCVDQALVKLVATLELPDVGASLSGTGHLTFIESPARDQSIHLVLDGIGACSLGGSLPGWPELLCNDGTFAGSKCLDASAFSPLPVDPRSGLGMDELLERGLQALPPTVACHKEPLEVAFSASALIPDNYCPYEEPNPAVPIVVDLVAPELGFVGQYGSMLWMHDGVCPDVTLGSEDEVDAAPKCTIVTASAGKAMQELPDILVWVTDDGSMVVSAGGTRLEPPTPDVDNPLSCLVAKALK